MKRLLLLITILTFSLLLAGCPGSLISTNLNPKDVKRSHKFIHVATEAKIINGNIIVMPIPNAIIRDNDWGKTNFEPQKFIELWNSASRVSSDTNLPIGVLQWREGVDLSESSWLEFMDEKSKDFCCVVPIIVPIRILLL